VFEYFSKYPDKLHSLSFRQYEILISEIFINQGYRSELGKGTNDGGVDIRLYQKDEIDQIVTLVQVKKYSPKRPIHLEAVSSLTAIVNQENANRGLFVTTSRYLPGVRKFAEREGSRLTLADSKDVVIWCENARNIIVRDKSTILTDNFLLDLIEKEKSAGLLGKVVVANTGYGMTSNDFCLVVKDSKDVALLMRIPSTPTCDEGGRIHTVGYEMPVVNKEILKYRNKENVFRARKHFGEGAHIGLSGDGATYYLWDGKPKYYDWND
jgi:restriction system protein